MSHDLASPLDALDLIAAADIIALAESVTPQLAAISPRFAAVVRAFESDRTLRNDAPEPAQARVAVAHARHRRRASVVVDLSRRRKAEPRVACPGLKATRGGTLDQHGSTPTRRFARDEAVPR